MTAPATHDDHGAAVQADYSKWVAVQAIDINGARAFNAGDRVPASHVEAGLVSRDAVSGVNTKAAAAVTTEKG